MQNLEVYLITIFSSILLLNSEIRHVMRTVPVYHILMVREMESATSLTTTIGDEVGEK